MVYTFNAPYVKRDLSKHVGVGRLILIPTFMQVYKDEKHRPILVREKHMSC